jgi:hypothetical protein
LEISASVEFDPALSDFVAGGDPEVLFRAACLVIGSNIPLDAEHALVTSEFAGCTSELLDSTTLATPWRRWIALMDEDGAPFSSRLSRYRHSSLVSST